MIELPGGLRVLDADECATLAAQEYRLRKSWRGDALPVPVALAELLAALAAAADARVTPRDAVGSGLVPTLSAPGSVAALSSWLTTREAAEKLGITVRAVVKACDKGALSAVRLGEGCGEWRIDPVSLDTYEPRSARGRRAADSTAA